MVESLILTLITFGGSAISYLLLREQSRIDTRLEELEKKIQNLESKYTTNKPVSEQMCADRRMLDNQKRARLSHRVTNVEDNFENLRKNKRRDYDD